MEGTVAGRLAGWDIHGFRTMEGMFRQTQIFVFNLSFPWNMLHPDAILIL